MRIVRLGLDRYGHHGGETLEFPAGTGLHLVLGANEAGKSTALEAVADGLFGFSRKHSRKLNHPDDARVSFTLRAADGTEASFLRRRTGKDKLLDGTGQPVAEAALARFLHGVSRERFAEVFGLDGERLRQAGRSIMSEHGDAGATVLQAQTGLHGLREALAKLDEEAKSLFGDGRGVRRISKAATAVKDNRRLIAERSLSGPEYLKEAAREAGLTAQLAAVAAEAKALRGEQARLERTRRTAPVRGALAEAAARLAVLGPPPALPPEAGARRAAALAAQAEAVRELDRDQDRQRLVGDALAALVPDPAVLAEAAAVTALAEDRLRIEQVRRDRLAVGGEAEAGLRRLDEAAARLGVPARGMALRPLVPDTGLRRLADRLLKQRAEQAGAQEVAAETLRRAERAAAEAAAVLAGFGLPANADMLRDVVEAANREGAIDAECAEAAAQHDLAAERAAEALAGLPLWSGGLARLQASPVPLDAEAARLGAALTEAATRLKAAVEAVDAQDAALDACRVAMAGLERAGPVPTLDAIAALRRQRDAAWDRVRGHGAATWNAEDAAVLTRLLAEADALADSRTSQAVRVAEWEQRLDEAARLGAGRTGLAARRDAAAAAMVAAQGAWRDAWAPAGVQPLDPAAMRDWVRARDGVLQAADAARLAKARHDQLAARHAAILARLQAAVPTATGNVAERRQVATRQLAALEAEAARHTAAADAARRGAVALADARTGLDGIERAAGAWRTDWAPVAVRLGLADTAGADAAADTLALWSDVQAQLDGWEALDRRVQDMRRALDTHDGLLAALAARLGVAEAPGLVAALSARLGAAQGVQAERSRLQAEAAGLADAVARQEAAVAAAVATLAALRDAAGAADDAALDAVIGRGMEHAQWTELVRKRQAELRTLDDGRSDAELAAEAALIDIDAVPGRLAEIDDRLLALDAEGTAAAALRAELRGTLRRMEAGQDVAGPAQEIQDSLAEIEDASHRYIRLRLAHTLLQGGLDRFRRSQQGPLLARAGAMFAELTGGRYERLDQDEGEKGEPVITAVRPDGSTCPAEMLSEGTRDQLFLALRLASVALDAAAAEPMPFIADDLLVNFDDARSAAALRLLARFGEVTQVILFTHHDHLAGLVDRGGASLHRLPGYPASAPARSAARV